MKHTLNQVCTILSDCANSFQGQSKGVATGNMDRSDLNCVVILHIIKILRLIFDVKD